MSDLYENSKKSNILRKNNYLCGTNLSTSPIMTDLRHLSNIKLQQILTEYDEVHANNNYISQNIAIARNINATLVKGLFGNNPLIMEEMRIMIVKGGWIKPVVNLVEQKFEAGDLVFLGPNGIVHVKELSESPHALGLALNNDLFSMAVGNNIPKAFDGHLRYFKVKLTSDELSFLDKLHEMISDNVKQGDHSLQVTLRLLSAFLWQVDYLLNKQEKQDSNILSREQQVFADFIQLVSQYAPMHHEIEFYAGKLYMSQRYMGNLIKKASGKTAKQWIDDTIVTRIKIELHHSDKQIQQIADEMNFTNTSFFTKFFRRMTGMTPNEFRHKR